MKLKKITLYTGIILSAMSLLHYSATAESVPPGSPDEPFEYDSSVFNDCNYCHGLHGARSDVQAMLNDKEERYSRYIGSTTPSEYAGRSVFEVEASRKCPRSRANAQQNRR